MVRRIRDDRGVIVEDRPDAAIAQQRKQAVISFEVAAT